MGREVFDGSGWDLGESGKEMGFLELGFMWIGDLGFL